MKFSAFLWTSVEDRKGVPWWKRQDWIESVKTRKDSLETRETFVKFQETLKKCWNNDEGHHTSRQLFGLSEQFFFFFFLVIEVQQYSSVIKWKAGSNTCSHNPQRLSWGPTALKMCCKQAGKANTDVLFQDLCKDLAVSTAKQDSRRKTYVWHMYLNL